MISVRSSLGSTKSLARARQFQVDSEGPEVAVDSPLDVVALAVGIVGSRGAAALWASSIRWMLHLLLEIVLEEQAERQLIERAARHLESRFGHDPTDFELHGSRWEGEWVGEVTRCDGRRSVASEEYVALATIPKWSWRARHAGEIRIADRVHVADGPDAAVVDIVSYRLAGGVRLTVRGADGEIRRALHPSTVAKAPERPTTFDFSGERHSFECAAGPIATPPGAINGAFLALSHVGCRCDRGSVSSAT